VVLYETARGVERVAVCSAEADTLGIRAGMTVAEVKAACGFAENDCKLQIANCKLQMEPYDPGADVETLQKLAERCERFTPTASVEPGERPECLLLDVGRVAGLFGGEEALATRLARDFARRGLAMRLGVADTIGAAWAAAHYGAKAACPQFAIDNLQFSICNLPPHGHPAALRPLPVEALRLSGETIDVLHQLGIDRVAQLEALPRKELAARFTSELLRHLDQAMGRLPEAIPGHRAGPEFQVEWSPEHPTTRRKTVEAALEQLVRDLCGQLARHGRGAVQLECRLLCPPREPVRIEVGLFQPSSAWEHLFGLVELKLERIRLPGPVVAVLVAATATAPLVYEQQELFSDEGGAPGAAASGGRGEQWRRRQLAGLVERLSSRLGRRAVAGVRLLADAQPELAWRYDPMVGSSSRQTARANPRSARSRKRDRRPSPASLPPRPLRLRRRPVALVATSMGPDRLGRHGCPVRFRFEGREHRVGRWWGPERIQTGWWRGRAVGRDYYRVETTAGRHYWLFRRLRDGKWFLQGEFD